MAKEKLYIYEDGACRGDGFTNKNILDKDKVVDLVERGLKLERGSDEWEDLLEDEIYGADFPYSVGVAIGSLITGSDCIGETPKQIKAKFNKLKKGKAVVIELEESTIGIGSSKKEARDACASVMVDEW